MKHSDNLNSFFENQENWDFEEPNVGHKERFLEKLKTQKPKKKSPWIPYAIVASLLITLGFLFFQNYKNTTPVVVFSPQVQETHDYFSSIINNELATLKEKETPENKALIHDAMKQMTALEKDYENLKLEIAKNGENKQIVYAMITNMQTRISFIKTVLDQVETINNLKIDTDEKQL